MSSQNSVAHTPAIREYEVFAFESYSVFVYDGGIIDGPPVIMHSAVLLKDSTRARCLSRQ